LTFDPIFQNVKLIAISFGVPIAKKRKKKPNTMKQTDKSSKEMQ
jgi:hypothetical protein